MEIKAALLERLLVIAQGHEMGRALVATVGALHPVAVVGEPEPASPVLVRVCLGHEVAVYPVLLQEVLHQFLADLRVLLGVARVHFLHFCRQFL